MNPHTKDKTAAYALGVGTMGVIAGLGIGGRPNTLALLVGVGSLFYANSLSGMIGVQSSRRISTRSAELRRSAASRFESF